MRDKPAAVPARRVAQIAAGTAAFLAPFTGSAVNIALPPIGKEFALDAVALGWVATVYMLTAAMFLVPFGRMADIYGRKRIFTIGLILFGTSALLGGLAPSAPVLIGFRVFQGIGVAMVFGTSVAILISVFPAAERGKVLGINVAVTYAGLSAGPVLGGFLTEHFGWRSVFFASAGLALAAVLMVFLRLKGEWADAKGEKFDPVGSIIYGAALMTTMYGFSLLPQTSGLGLVLLGVAGIGVFVWWELRSPSPVLNINLFRHSMVFAFSNLAALIHYCASFAVSFLLSLYLQYIQGLSPGNAGLILVFQPVVMAAISPIAGRMSDRRDPKWIASLGMALTTVGLIMFIFLNSDTHLWFIIVALLIMGFGFGLFSSPNTHAVMGSVETRFYGVASGTLGTMRLVGQMLSLGIVMMLFALYMGRVQITPASYPAFLHSIRVAFIGFSALCFGGIFASLARGNSKLH